MSNWELDIGGSFSDLDSALYFAVTAHSGTGMLPVRNHIKNLPQQPGGQYDGTDYLTRTLVLEGMFNAVSDGSLTNYHSRHALLLKALNVDGGIKISDKPDPLTLRYTGGAMDKDIFGYYEGGLEGGPNGAGAKEDIQLRIICDDPLWYDTSETTQAIDTNDSATFSYIGRRVTDGSSPIWDNMGPQSGGTITSVRDIVVLDNVAYICGNFTNWDGIANADYIVSYDLDLGTYSALGTGADNVVTRVKIGPDGNIYACGIFTTIGGTTCRGIGYWNGSTWNALGPPSSGGTVNDFDFDGGGNIYIAGTFTNWDGIANADYVAYWDGSTWNAMSTGANNFVYDIRVQNAANIYVKGDFTSIGGVSVNYVARWDGSAWNAMAAGIDDATTLSGQGMDIDENGFVYVAGVPDGVSGTGVSYWNGQSWNQIGTINNIETVDFGYDGLLYVGGQFNDVDGVDWLDGIAAWNGSVWIRPDINIPGTSTSVFAVRSLEEGLFLGMDATGTGNFSGDTTEAYAGTARGYPYFEIGRSGGTSAKIISIRNETTGAVLYLDYDLLDGETLTIDCRPRQQAMTSDFFGNVYSKMLPNSDVGAFYLDPGRSGTSNNNVITCFVDVAGAPTITANMKYTAAYLSCD